MPRRKKYCAAFYDTLSLRGFVYTRFTATDGRDVIDACVYVVNIITRSSVDAEMDIKFRATNTKVNDEW